MCNTTAEKVRLGISKRSRPLPPKPMPHSQRCISKIGQFIHVTWINPETPEMHLSWLSFKVLFLRWSEQLTLNIEVTGSAFARRTSPCLCIKLFSSLQLAVNSRANCCDYINIGHKLNFSCAKGSIFCSVMNEVVDCDEHHNVMNGDDEGRFGGDSILIPRVTWVLPRKILV